MKTNLVIAAWSGPRRNYCYQYEVNRSFFLKKQILSLSRLKHNLDQITIMVPYNPENPKEFNDYLTIIPKKINNADVAIIKRDNIGLSYGSFSDAYKKYMKLFDYYIFLEDDYVFVEDNFDETLVGIFNRFENCGYLSQLTHKNPPHPSVFNGITSSEILSKIWLKMGRLPHGNVDYSSAENLGQIGFGNILLGLGYNLCDLSDYYRIIFLDFNNQTILYGEKNAKSIIIPSQRMFRKQFL